MSDPIAEAIRVANARRTGCPNEKCLECGTMKTLADECERLRAERADLEAVLEMRVRPAPWQPIIGHVRGLKTMWDAENQRALKAEAERDAARAEVERLRSLLAANVGAALGDYARQVIGDDPEDAANARRILDQAIAAEPLGKMPVQNMTREKLLELYPEPTASASHPKASASESSPVKPRKP